MPKGCLIPLPADPDASAVRIRKELEERTGQDVADNIASAAELVMGEADEGVPAALIRGLMLPISDDAAGVESIDASECLFMGLLTHSPAQR